MHTDSHMHSHKLTPVTLALLLLPPLFWGGNAVVGRLMVGHIAPLALSFDRWFFALVCALPFTARELWRARAVLRARAWPLLRMSFLGVACYNSMQYVALHTTTPLNVALISASAPEFINLIGALFHAERVGPEALVGSALSLAGVGVVVTRGEVANLAQVHFAAGDLVMLLAVLCWGFYTWDLRRHPLGLKPLPSLAAQMALGTLMIAPFAAFERWGLGDAPPWVPSVALAVAYVAVLASLLAYVCWGAAVARTGAQIPSYFANLMPLFVAVLQWLFLHQGIRLFHVAGGALIFAGIHVSLRARTRAVGT